uniref:Uncharacterized protein n=1 Tax=Triticum urartu TaxID=4572 RepID=A0A8R7VGZ5_TRIUA
MSSSNPRSTSLSASSKVKYLQLSRFIFFLARRSLSRPGVATTICTPFFTTSSCVLMSIPPMQSNGRISGNPACLSGVRNISMTSYVCLASSRDGQMIMPNGPSPGTIGINISSCRATMMRGSTNTRVFPDPVKAMPIMSRPESTTGSPCTWMGVGCTMPFSRSIRRTGSGKRRSRKSR